MYAFSFSSFIAVIIFIDTDTDSDIHRHVYCTIPHYPIKNCADFSDVRFFGGFFRGMIEWLLVFENAHFYLFRAVPIFKRTLPPVMPYCLPIVESHPVHIVLRPSREQS